MSSHLTAKSRVLLIEDNPGDIFLLREMVNEEAHEGFHIEAEARNLADGIAHLNAGEADVVLLDLSLPDSRGLDTFTTAHRAAPDVPIIVLSGVDDEELALQTVQLGAQEYLVKGRINAQVLRRALRYAIERARAENQLAHERDLLSTLLENIPDRIYFKDRRSRFIRINRALTVLLGLKKPDDAYGKTDADFYGTEHAQSALEDERHVMQTGEPILGKVEFETDRKSVV